VDKIRETTQKEWDEKKGKHASIPWEPPKPPNFHLLTKDGRKNEKQAAINAKYNSMRKEIQINVVKELSSQAHLAFLWYDVTNRDKR
jgi:hypothetical protein